MVYGSPWSGKTPCYKAERYPLAGCVRLSQAPYNKIRRLNTLQAYAALHPSAPPSCSGRSCILPSGSPVPAVSDKNVCQINNSNKHTGTSQYNSAARR